MQIISRMAVRTLKSHKRRSLTLILAALLSAFMIFCVFTVGVTYFQMQRLQNIRMSGGEFDAIMYGVSDEQKKSCEENPNILRAGVSAMSGYVAETEFDGTPNVVFMWADEVWWNEIMTPARKWVKGRYPVEENEVMVTEYALEKCGFKGLKTGDEFTAVYGAGDVKQETTFRISGIWDGYGDKSVFFVSEKFYRQTGFEPADVASGRICVQFRQRLITQRMQEEFIEAMNLRKQQRLFFTVDSAFSVQILLGIAGLVLVTCLCAYLLIYNIMYLTVAGNIRYYGLLQTIGMTGRQLRYLVRRQMLLIGGIGILGGIVLGSGVSFLVVPSVVKALGIRMGKGGDIQVTFHPMILVLTVLFTGITVFAAGRKPGKMAVVCSPMEALGYRPCESQGVRAVKQSLLEKLFGRGGTEPKRRRGSFRRAGSNDRIWRMAKESIAKDKKKAGIVMLSLAAGMSVFLCMVTLLVSQGAREYNPNFRDFDLMMKNDTITKEKQEERVQIFDGKVMEKLKEIEGIREIDPLVYTEIAVPWEADFADQWMRKFYEMWMTIPYEEDLQEYKDFPENFGSSLVGIGKEDFEALNELAGQTVDEEDFLRGKTCLLYRNSLDLENDDVKGKRVTCTEYGNRENALTFEIAGLIDGNDYTALLGYPPTIIVSRQVVEEFVEEPLIFKIGLRYEEDKKNEGIWRRMVQTGGYQPSKAHEDTEASILAVMDDSPYRRDYSYGSKIEMMNEVKKAQGNMMEVGIGVALILAFIGVMNYVNTFIGNIQNKRVEIAILESIGMTGRQVRKMLLLEGLLYALGAWVVTAVGGTAVTYGIYQSVNYMGADFMVPLLPVLGMMAVSAAVCVSVPAAAYRSIEKGGIVEYIVMPC